MEGIEVVHEIGRGNYGSVWLVRRPGSPRNLVLKYVDLTHCTAAEVEAARQEVRILAGLRHPNIVSYKGSFEVGRRLHLLMGHCAGGDMASLIKRQRGQLFPEVKIVRWLIQITMALQYLHHHNILHRDLKTQNIFLTRSCLVKLGDFGIARILGSSYDMATTLVGTPYYMSPELFAGLPYNHKSDVWALGCCLYELATLRHAFPARDIPGLISKISKGKISGLHERYSDDLRQLVLSLMTRSPEYRPSASQVLRFPYIRQHMSLFLKDTSGPSENRIKHEVDTEEEQKRIQDIEKSEPSGLQGSDSCSTKIEGCQSSAATEQHKHMISRRCCKTVPKEFELLQIAGDKVKLEKNYRGEMNPSDGKECSCPRREEQPASHNAGHLHSQSRARRRGSREVEGSTSSSQGQSNPSAALSPTNPRDLSTPRSSLSARERRRQQWKGDVERSSSATSACAHLHGESSGSEDNPSLSPADDSDDYGNSNSNSPSNTASPTHEEEEEEEEFLSTLSSTLTASSSPCEEDGNREEQDDRGRDLEAKITQLEGNLVTMLGKVQARLVIEVLKEEANDDEVSGNWEARLNEVEQVLGGKLESEAATTAWNLHFYYVLQHT